MDSSSLAWSALPVALLLIGLWWSFRKGKAAERADVHKSKAKHEKVKSDALQNANAARPGSIRDKLRRIARRKSDLSD